MTGVVVTMVLFTEYTYTKDHRTEKTPPVLTITVRRSFAFTFTLLMGRGGTV